MSSPLPGQYPAPPKKKIHPVVWVLIGLAGCFLLVIMAVVAGGVYVASRIAQNPAEAAALIAAGNPDVEVVSSNRDRGLVTFREKSTGKTVTVNLEQLKQGRIVFTDQEKEKEVVLEAGPHGVRIQDSDGKKVEIGNKPQ